VDPIADQFAWVSVYNYAENEPIRHIDLHGLQKFDPQQAEQNLVYESTRELQSFASKVLGTLDNLFFESKESATTTMGSTSVLSQLQKMLQQRGKLKILST
jgi:hypothetical protein